MSPTAPAADDEARESLTQILRAVRTHLGMDVAFIGEFADGQRHFRHVDQGPGADPERAPRPGESDPLEESLCQAVTDGRLPGLLPNSSADPLARALPATERRGVGALLSVPIRLCDGRTYGTICCYSHTADPSLNRRDLATLQAFAQIASKHIGQDVERRAAVEAKRSRISGMLAQRALHMVYQPAVRLSDHQIAFVEALARFETPPVETPDRWFRVAAEVGMARELELAAIAAAVADLPALPDGTDLSLNISADTIIAPGLRQSLAGAPLGRIILEITEHDAVRDYARLTQALDPLRACGVRIAVDDAGAGYASLRHILQIRPDIIKLDMSLTRGIDTDPAQRALAVALVDFASGIGSRIVAEGVEHEAELQTLARLGVHMVQGYLLGRPARLQARNAAA